MIKKISFLTLLLFGIQSLTAQCLVSITPGNPPAICSGDSLILVADGWLQNSSWSWSPAIGLNTTTGDTVIASPTATTTYIVTRSCHPSGFSTTDSVTVTVIPISNAGPNISICSGEDGLIGSPPTSGTTYSWSPAFGLNDSTDSNPTINLTNITSSPVDYVYALTTTNTATGCVSSDSVTVTVNPLPTASPGANISVCSGEDGIIGASSVSGNIYSWSPAFGLNDSTDSDPTVNLTNITSSPVDYVYALTTTNTATSCVSSDSVTVTINPQAVADFTFNNDVCSSVPIQFTNTSSNATSYYWNFGDGLSGQNNSSTDSDPTHNYSSIGSSTQAYNISLVATNSFGCIDSLSQNINLNQIPDAVIADYNSSTPFTNCSDGSFNLSVTNTSSTAAGNTNYTIDWGDGSQDFNLNNWSFQAMESHLYPSQGNFTLTLTVTGQNGCSSTETYNVYNGSNPSGNIGNPGSTILYCAPYSLTFPLDNTSGNPPGTTYTITTNTGSPPVIYNHPPPSSYTHVFTTTSCGATSGIAAAGENAFVVELLIENPCGFSASFHAPITSGMSPIAEFIISPDTITCVNTTVNFTNTTISGAVVDAFGTCSDNTLNNWEISPNIGWTVVNGNLGSPNPNNNPFTWGSNTLGIQFSAPGTYDISMIARTNANGCGNDTVTKTVCIQPVPEPSFTLNNNIGCSSLNVNTTNTSNTLIDYCIPAEYNWTVSYSPDNCGLSSEWSFTGGTSEASTNPSFLFNNSGIYTITLAVTNKCGTFYSSETVTVKQPPTVNIAPIDDSCIPYTISPTATVNNCGDDSMTYSWTSAPAGLNSLLPNPAQTTLSSLGLNTISLAVTNECGTTSDNTSFTITPLNTITPGIDQTVCMNSPITDILIFTTGATGAQVTGLPQGLTDSWSGDTLTISGSPTESGTFTYTVETTGGCPSDITTGTLEVTPLNTITTGIDQTVCMSSPITNILLFTTGATGVQVTGLPQGITDSWSGDTLTISGIPTEIGTFTYTVETTGGCPSATTTGTLEVTPLNTITTGIDQTVCMSSPITNILLFTTGATGVQVTGLPQGITDSWSGDTLTISGIPTEIGTFTYTVETTGGCPPATTTGTLDVTPLNTISVGIDENVCIGSSINNIIIVTSGATGAIFSNLPAGINGTWVNNIITISGVPTESGTFIYTVETTGGCPSGIASGTISVSSLNTIEQGINQTVCVGSNIFISLPTTGATNASFSGLPPGVEGLWLNDTVIISGNPLISGAFNYTVETTGGCIPAMSSSTITVNPDPIIDIQPLSSQSICVGGTIDQALVVSYTGGVGGATYQWQLDGLGIVGAEDSTYLPPVFNTIGTSLYSVVVSLSGSGCDAVVSDSAEVIVISDPIMSLQPVDASYCQDASPVIPLVVSATGGLGTYNYQWYNNTVNSNSGGTVIVGAIDSTYTPPVNTVGVMYYYCVITQSGPNCDVVSLPGAITTTEGPTFVIQPLPSQTVCLGGGVTALNVSFQNGTGIPSYQWYITTNTGVLGTAIAGEINPSYTPPTDLVGTFYYYCEITFSSGGCTSITSDLGAITVNPDPVIDIQPLSSQSICVGGTIDQALVVSYTGGVGGATYQWQLDGLGIVGAEDSTYLPPVFNTIGTSLYSVVVSLSGSGCDAVVSDSAEVIVISDPIMSLQPVDASYCQDASPVIPLVVSATGGLGTYNYQWYNNTVNSNSGGTVIVGAIDSTYTPPVNTVGVMYYYCVITQSGPNCDVVSLPGAITTTEGPTFVIQPLPSQTVCLGGGVTALNVSFQNGTGIPSYQWYITTNTGVLGTAIAGEINPSYTPPTDLVGTFYYYCEITFSSGGCTSITSDLGAITVNPDPVIDIQPLSSQSICVGGTIDQALVVSYTGGVGGATYQWQLDGLGIVGAEDSTYLPPVFNTIGTSLYSVVVSLSGSGCDAVVSDSAEVIVISDPIMSLQPVDASYCQDASPVIPLVVSATGGLGTYNYQWYNNTVNSNSGGTVIVGAIDSTYTPPVNTVGVMYYYCVITQSGPNCDVVSLPGAITTTEGPTFVIQPLPSQTVCLGGGVTALNVSFQNGTGIPSYQWYITTNTGVLGTAIAGEINPSYTPPTDLVGTFYYYCEITFSSGGCTSITSDLGAITVNPDPVIDIQPLSSQSICVGGTIDQALVVSYTGGVGGATYQWQLDGLGIVGAEDSTYLPPVFNTIGTSLYSVVVSLSGSGCDAVVSDSAEVIVISDPIMSLQPVDASYCQDASPVIPLVVSATGGLGTYNYQWYNNTVNSNSGGTVIVGAIDSTYTPPVNTVGVMYYYCVITQSGPNCDVVSLPGAITTTEGPTFVIQPLPSQTVCLGGGVTALNVSFQNGTGIPSYQWYITTNTGVLGTAIAGEINPSYTPPTDLVGTFYYYCEITFSSGGCTSITSDLGAITVNPDPVIDIQPLSSQSICVGGTIDQALVVSYTGGVGGATYQWQLDGLGIVGAEDSTYLPPVFNTIGTSLYSVVVSLSGSGCDAVVSDSAEVIVISDPIMSLQPVDASYCQDASPVIPLVVSATGGLGTYNYQWYNNTVNSNSGGTVIVGAIDSTYTPPVNTVGVMYYYCVITQSGPNCDVVSLPGEIAIINIPVIITQPISNQNVCVGGIPSILSVSYLNGNNSASYQWYENNSNSNIGGTPILGANSSSYLPLTNGIGTTYYYCVINFAIGGCSSIISNTSELNIFNNITIDTQPLLSQIICEGSSVNQSLSFSYSGGSGSSSIAWYQFGPPNILINGVSGTSFQPSNFNTPGTYQYYAEVSDSALGCITATTINSQIIVNPTPYINELSDTVICNNNSLNVNITTSIPSNIQWFANQNVDVSGELTSIQTSSIIDDLLINNTTIPQYVNYNITPTSFPFGCVGPDSTFTVQIQPDIILSTPSNIEICSGSPVNAILASNVASNFNWFASVDNPNVIGESFIQTSDNLITDILINNTSVNQVVVYSIFPTSILGDCIGEVQTVTVTVKPPLSLLNEDTLTICSGNSVNLSLIANTNVIFNWYADQSVNILNETTSIISSSLINDTLQNLTNTVQEVTYNVIGTSIGNGCSSPTIPITVFVNPLPSVTLFNDTILCNESNVSPIVFNGPVLGSIYDWNSSNSLVGITQQSGQTFIPGFIASNNSNNTQSTIITVVPTYENNNVPCIGSNDTFSISVIPTPSVNQLSNISVCDGDQVPELILSGQIIGTIFNWTNSNTSISLNSSGAGNLPSFIAENSTEIPLISNITVVPSIQSGNLQCLGLEEDYSITVNPSPNILNSDVEICTGENTNILLNANIPSTFEWQATPTITVFNETSFPVQSSGLINDILTINSSSAQTVDYNITATSLINGCIGPISIIEVLLNPLPIVDFIPLNTSLCDLQPVNFQNNSPGILDVSWEFGDGNTSNLYNPSHTYNSIGSYTVELTATNPFTGCTNSSSLPVVVSETPNALFTYSDSLGCGVLDVVFSADVIDPNLTYLWDFGNGQGSQQLGVSGEQFTEAGCYDISLEVTSNTGCASTFIDVDAICIFENPIAQFSTENQVFSTLEDVIIQFNNESLYATDCFWDFGDYQTSIVENPSHDYPNNSDEYIVTLIASNEIGCLDTASLLISVIQDISVFVPNAFTPDNDEFNQYFNPILSKGFKLGTYHLTIFNRWGQIVFESFNSSFGWDGTYNGEYCQDGTYIWKISVDEERTGENRLYHGHVNLIKGRAE